MTQKIKTECERCLREGCYSCETGKAHGVYECVCYSHIPAKVDQEKYVSSCCGVDVSCDYCHKNCQVEKGQSVKVESKEVDTLQGDSWEKDTLKEWIDVFDLDLEDSKRMATLIDIIIKKATLQEKARVNKQLEDTLKEIADFNVSAWKKIGEERGYWNYFKDLVLQDYQTDKEQKHIASTLELQKQDLATKLSKLKRYVATIGRTENGKWVTEDKYVVLDEDLQEILKSI